MYAALAFFTTYYVAAAAQAVIHRLLAHRREHPLLYQEHITGHHDAYPQKALLQDRWLTSQKWALWRIVVPMCLPSGAIALALQNRVATAHLAGLLFSIAWHAWLHRQYHAWQSPLTRFAWFRRKRAWHFVHHQAPDVNFALVETWVDRAMGTFRKHS
jgi:sterol desaturase/sphingolipid hydroxylase (fatty acid hydroxylase superfamily)